MSEEIPIIALSNTKELSQPKVYRAWATICMGLAIGVFALLAMQILVAVVFRAAELAFNLNPVNEGLVTAWSIIATGLGGMLLMYFIARMNGNHSLVNYIGLQRLTWKIVLLALAAFIIALVCIYGLSILWSFFLGDSGNSANAEFIDDIYSGAGWLLLFVATVVVAPVFEESLFRGFLFVGLQSSRIGVVGTVILTSLVWALLHMQYNLFGMFAIMVMGVVLGVTRYKTHSLWSAIIVHAMWNGMAFLQALG
ncbi:MAG: CPBP family intramembrane metalloprotease [Dehalococcoidia bacterium]|nr:CPBP family intramembrane metalloprotease [Dehalococcoidia bacterium]